MEHVKTGKPILVGSCSPPGKMYSCSAGILSNASIVVPKFFARTSFGVCANQSVN